MKLRTPRGTYRHESRWLSLIARYAVAFVGILLATSFATSVRYDDADIARAAWVAGGELLGTFGVIAGFGLPFLGLLTAITRRGRERKLHFVELRPDALVFQHAAGQRELPWAQLRSGIIEPREDGRVRLSLEVAGGLREGDRIELVAEPELGEALRARLDAGPSRHDLATRSLRYGAAMWSLASVGGTAAGLGISEQLWQRIADLPGPFPNFAWGEGWALGLVVACIGALRLALQIASLTPSVVVGVDGMIVERLLSQRFVPFAEMRRVHTSVLGLRIELVRGGSLRVWAFGMSPTRLRALADTLRARISESGACEAALPRLEEAPVSQWAEAVVHEATAGDYRKSPPGEDALLRQLEAPGTPRDLRVAAAVALRAREGPQAAAKIRVAARRLADEPTRELLAQLAEEEADLAEVEAALAKRGTSGA